MGPPPGMSMGPPPGQGIGPPPGMVRPMSGPPPMGIRQTAPHPSFMTNVAAAPSMQ